MAAISVERRREVRTNDPQGPEFEAARPVAQVREVEAGEAIYRAGDNASHLFVLVTGRVRLVQKSSRGPLVLTGELGPGSLFGIDCLSMDKHGESAIAEERCLVREVLLVTVDRLVARQPGFAAGILEALVRRRTTAERLLARAIISGVPGRLAGALLDAAEGNLVEGRTRRELAEAAWTTRETATRVLFHFVEDGLVEVDGRRITLRDRDRLRRLAGGARESRAA